MPTPSVIQRVRELRDLLPSSPTTAELARQIDTVLLDPQRAAGYASLRERLGAALADYPKLQGVIQGVIAELTAAGL